MPTRRFLARPVLLCLLFFCAPFLVQCKCDEGVSQSNTEIKATPDALTFSGSQGQEDIRSLLIEIKTGPVQINSIAIDQGKSFFRIDPETLPALPKAYQTGDQITVRVIYTAPAGSAASGRLRIESSAVIPREGYLDVPLLASATQPQLVITPNPVDFGELQQGESKDMEILVENKGNADLKLTSILWDPASSPGFTFPDGIPQPQELKAGASFKFKAKYEPTTRNPDLGTMAFKCEGGSCSPSDPDPTKRGETFLLRFEGKLAAPSIQVTPTQIDFGFVASGSSKREAIQITNVGSAPLEVSKIALKAGSSGAFIVPTITGLVLQPRESRPVVIEYRPSTGSGDQGVVQIDSNDPSSPVVDVPLSGKVSAPNIDVTPRKMNFGKVAVKKTLPMTIANIGDRELTVNTLQMAAGSSPEFKFDNPPTFPLKLAPNKFTTIQVVYEPIDATVDGGKIEIFSDDPDEPKIEVTLQGEGSSARICDLVPVPQLVNFGLSIIGKTKVIPIKWTNQGALDCTITKIETFIDRSGFPPYSGPNVFVLPSLPPQCPNGACNPPLVIQPTQSVDIPIGFSPVAEKEASPLGSPSFDGQLRVTLQGTPPYREADLTGLAVKSCVEVVPDQLNIGLVTINCSSKDESILIYNTCNAAITVNKVGFSSAGANGFRIVKAQTTPFTINPGQNSDISVAYRATAPPSKQTAVLEIEHSLTQQSPLSVPLSAEGTTNSEQTDVFNQATQPKVDILFVIDNSGSMGDEQASLGSNFSSFINFAQTLQVDFQIGITTTDVSTGTPLGGGNNTPGGLRGSPKIMDNATPNLNTIFRQNANVGTNGSATEAGLEAARLALSHPLINTDIAQGGNKGFLRQDASLAIIVVSDEPDSSSGTAPYYINFLRNIKGVRNPDLLRFNGVIGYDTKSKQNSCSNGSQSASSSGRYLAVIQATNGVAASICDSNWSGTLGQLGSVTFGYRKQFFLSRYADPATVTVKVNGQVVSQSDPTNGWNYVPQDNSVAFNNAPVAGAKIEITYKAICF
ncbi:MAG: choice-of-anchor D domain-containing protein [Myxococcales bacterium]|nr:choice-of-anchor D domain-containing protein [Myxococcales bacterium]